MKILTAREFDIDQASNRLATAKERVMKEIKKVICGAENRSPLNYIPGEMVFEFDVYAVSVTSQSLDG